MWGDSYKLYFYIERILFSSNEQVGEHGRGASQGAPARADDTDERGGAEADQGGRGQQGEGQECERGQQSVQEWQDLQILRRRQVHVREGLQNPPRHLGLQSATFNLYLTLPLP